MTETAEENVKITEEVVKPQQGHPKGAEIQEESHLHAPERDIERLELDELQVMENKIQEQIRLKKMASVQREPIPKPKEKRRERKEDDKEESKEQRKEKKQRIEAKEEPPEEKVMKTKGLVSDQKGLS